MATVDGVRWTRQATAQNDVNISQSACNMHRLKLFPDTKCKQRCPSGITIGDSTETRQDHLNCITEVTRSLPDNTPQVIWQQKGTTQLTCVHYDKRRADTQHNMKRLGLCQSANRLSKLDALRMAALLMSGSAPPWHFVAGSVNEMAAMCRQRKRGPVLPISTALLTSDRSPIVVIFAIKGRQTKFLPLFVPQWHAYCSATWTTPSSKM